ncbi:hypothetical protein B5F40_03740 [Gordonibacter sp. An230]|uniref:DUF4176 domain-containing protein n=1 Tax=Gordonibacter sp. An230 TaxID=1965592 RepID=UPI000B38B603|nr:DUF4176 domain-containing protein [Gordonibacter sp. An230]OUO91554.1 hypothetical protein B5F40_03740 [Gordonibacter sp. An230]
MSEIRMDWLPMGSVVRLEGAEVPVMVVGRMQRERGGSRVWEYAACPYPCGFEDSSQAVLFDGGSVEHVLFLGYRTDAELAWCERLDEERARLASGAPGPAEGEGGDAGE